MAIEVKSLFVGKPEVAKILGCSERLVDILRSNHGLPCLRIGALVRFDPERVKAWAYEQAETCGVKSLKRFEKKETTPEIRKHANKKSENMSVVNPCGGARSEKGEMTKKSIKLYFSHDADAMMDPKILELRLKHGPAGYGVFWMILEEMREQTDYRLEKNFERLTLLIRETDTELVRSVIEDFGLFQTDENGKIYSESFLKRMEIKDAKLETCRRNGLGGRGANNSQSIDNQSSDNFSTIDKQLCDKDKDKDKVKDKDNITTTDVVVSSVPSTESTEPTPPEGVLTEFSLELNTGKLYRLPKTEYDQFVENFPGVDVSAELRKMASWCHTNKENRKTRKGILQFVNRWLSSAQDKSSILHPIKNLS